MPLNDCSPKSGMKRLLAPLLMTGMCLGLGMSLGGCSGMSKALGMSKDSPDEFTVVARTPLVIPPHFNLMPPEKGQPGQLTKTEPNPQKMAMEALFPPGRTGLPALAPAAKPQTAAPAAEPGNGGGLLPLPKVPTNDQIDTQSNSSSQGSDKAETPK